MKKPELILCEFSPSQLDGIESYSPYCLKVHRALRRAGLRYGSRYAKRPSDIEKLNPIGQVPVLLVDGVPICDSTRIVRHVETLCDESMAAHLSPAQIAEAQLWEELADTALNGFTVAARWADDENWPRCREAFFAGAPRLLCALITPRLRARILRSLVARDVWRAGPEACWTRFEETLDQLDARAPTDGFWVAASLSVADLAIFAQLQSLRCPLTPRQAERIGQRSRLSAYLERVDHATRARVQRTPTHATREIVALLAG